ncbi:MAG: hypothetical protein Q4G41_02090 [Coriobacteriales bacterium]|nr:hypothetical protein [Coriobacteriales bacterium]
MPLHTDIDVSAQEDALRQPETARLLCEELVSRGARRVILMGTPSIMGTPLLKTPLAKAGIMVFTPPQDYQLWLAEVIEGELAQGEATEATRRHFELLIADGAEHGIDHLVIASTGLMKLARACAIELPIINALR